jgi:hypothetical protein
MGFQMGTRAIRQTYQLHGMDIKIHECRLDFACLANIALNDVGRAIQQAHIYIQGLCMFQSNIAMIKYLILD